MVRRTLATILLTILGGTQCGCLDSLMRPDPHSGRTATAYPTDWAARSDRASQRLQAYLTRLRGVQPPTEASPAVPMRMRPAIVPLVPLDAPAPPAGPLRAPTRQVTIPDLPPAGAPTVVQTPLASPPATTAAAEGPPPAPPTPAAGQDGQPERSIAGYLAHTESLAAANPDDLDLQLQLRMLQMAAGQDTKALQPVKGLTRQENANVAALLRMMMGIRDRTDGETGPTEAAERLKAIETLRRHLMRFADLQIPALKLCRSVDGYGVYETFPAGNRFAAGRNQQVIVYCELKNFTAKPDQAGMYRTRLNMTVGLYDPQGSPAQPAMTVNNIEDISANRRNDFFLSPVYALRNTLKPGKYTLKVTIEDPVANKVATRTLDVEITQ